MQYSRSLGFATVLHGWSTCHGGNCWGARWHRDSSQSTNQGRIVGSLFFFRSVKELLEMKTVDFEFCHPSKKSTKTKLEMSRFPMIVWDYHRRGQLTTQIINAWHLWSIVVSMILKFVTHSALRSTVVTATNPEMAMLTSWPNFVESTAG